MIFKAEKNGGVNAVRSDIALLLLSAVIVFQLSLLKYTLNLGGVATVVNSMMLLGLSVIAVKNVFTRSYPMRVWLFFLVPALLVYGAYLQNLVFSLFSNSNAVSGLGVLIPWAACLSVPFFIRSAGNRETIWRFFYHSMLIVCIVGLLEYVLGLNGILPLRTIDNPYADFLSPGVTVFFMLADGIPHYRFYAIFPEPGTFAMYLLPVIMYALVYKKYVGFVLFVVALVLTDSLGGLVGLLLLMLIYIYRRLMRTRLSVGLAVIVVSIVAAVALAFTYAALTEAYLEKDQSKTVREDNVANVIANLPSLLMTYPFGFTLAEGSLSNIDSKDNFGSTFALGNAIVLGGVFAFLGYFLVLISCFIISLKSITNKVHDLDSLVIFPSLLVVLTFIFQRATVMDSAMYSLLFAPSIVQYLQSQEKTYRL